MIEAELETDGGMMPKLMEGRGAAILVASLIAGVALAGPAVADETADELSADEAAVAVENVAIKPDTGPIEEAEAFTIAANGSLEVSGEGSEVAIESGESPTITLDSEIYEPLIVSGGLEGEAEIWRTERPFTRQSRTTPSFHSPTTMAPFS